MQHEIKINAEAEALERAQADARHEPGPIPDGKIFTVQGFGQDGKEVETEGYACGARMSHDEAITLCNLHNTKAIAQNESFWFGVKGVDPE